MLCVAGGIIYVIYRTCIASSNNQDQPPPYNSGTHQPPPYQPRGDNSPPPYGFRQYHTPGSNGLCITFGYVDKKIIIFIIKLFKPLHICTFYSKTMNVKVDCSTCTAHLFILKSSGSVFCIFYNVNETNPIEQKHL